MHPTRQPDSKALLTCPKCGAARYVNQEFLDLMTHLEGQQGPDLKMEAVLPRHKPCNAIMRMQRLRTESPTEPAAARTPTSELLARDLAQAQAPASMIAHARAGGYDDYRSESATPIVDLVRDARTHGLSAIAEAAIEGKYDAQRWESDEWAKSEEGQAAFREFGPYLGTP